MKFERPRGTRDFPPDDMLPRQLLADTLRSVFESYCYRRIGVPAFEHLELFTEKSGQEITENLYAFQDKSGRRICLRPEATASVARMYANELMHLRKPLKLYYFGPMYRYERPQKGRYREFWQTGAELVGAAGVEADAEVIQLAVDCLDALDLDYRLSVGHLGILRGLLADHGVSEEKQTSLLGAVDRGDTEILKDDEDYRLISCFQDVSYASGVDDLGQFVTDTTTAVASAPRAKDAFAELSELIGVLEKRNVSFSVELGMARGLAYYTGMVFEVSVDGLGAQSQIAGGGRYDCLIETFGGPPTPAVGFAFGFDRLLDACFLQDVAFDRRIIDVAVAPIGDVVRFEAHAIAGELRSRGLRVDVDLAGRKLKAILSQASQEAVPCVVIVGAKDLKEGSVTVRDMRLDAEGNAAQRVVNREAVADAVYELLNS